MLNKDIDNNCCKFWGVLCFFYLFLFFSNSRRVDVFENNNFVFCQKTEIMTDLFFLNVVYSKLEMYNSGLI